MIIFLFFWGTKQTKVHIPDKTFVVFGKLCVLGIFIPLSLLVVILKIILPMLFYLKNYANLNSIYFILNPNPQRLRVNFLLNESIKQQIFSTVMHSMAILRPMYHNLFTAHFFIYIVYTTT